MEKNGAQATNNRQIWDCLCSWIRERGGEVHGGLELRDIASDLNENRGVFATQPIAINDMLVKLPRSLAISGENMPQHYDYLDNTKDGLKKEQRQASSWLRCLAAYCQTQQQVNKKRYLDSLPKRYETVSLSWSEQEIETFLSGTSTPSGESLTWRNDEGIVRQRYQQQIRPYLEACGILSSNNNHNNEADKDENNSLKSSEIQDFLVASQCLSTRAFHVQSSPQQHLQQAETDESCAGPFLLPCIDLLNHSSSSTKKCTTLQSDADFFWIKAERPVAVGEEVLHSYGDGLTICQFLQTFGFVERDTLEALASGQMMLRNPTPALLSKQRLLDECFHVIESGLPEQLSQAMQRAEMEDEIWTVRVDRTRTADFLPEDLVVDRGQPQQASRPLSDTLVTCACLPFLPKCAYVEAKQSLIGIEVLQDFFLGHLVCKSLLNTIQSRLDMYKFVVWQDETKLDDQQLLQELLDSSVDSSRGGDETDIHRAMYGLALRLDEKASLRALQRQVLEVLSDLGDAHDNNDDGADSSEKRAKTT